MSARWSGLSQASGHGDLSDHWVDAGKLTPDDRLVTPDHSFAEVIAVRSEPQENFKAYNLSVADYATFFVRSDEDAEAIWMYNASNRCSANSRPRAKAMAAEGRQ